MSAVIDNFHFAEVLPISTEPVKALKRKKDTFKIDDSLAGFIYYTIKVGFGLT